MEKFYNSCSVICLSSVNEHSQTNRPSQQVYCSMDYTFLQDILSATTSSTELSSQTNNFLHINCNYIQQRLCLSSQTLCKLLYKWFFAKSQCLLHKRSTSKKRIIISTAVSALTLNGLFFCSKIVLPNGFVVIEDSTYVSLSLFVIIFFSEAHLMGLMVLLSYNDSFLCYTDQIRTSLFNSSTTCSKFIKLQLETFKLSSKVNNSSCIFYFQYQCVWFCMFKYRTPPHVNYLYLKNG